ncbi:MAG TPA: M36 family metallopeptidase [Thermoleophilaceae bacterium]|nr:M36 family metallopeptidase [Thermoleophilaceae bacterium]
MRRLALALAMLSVATAEAAAQEVPVRTVARPGGFLTRPSERPAREVALDYVRRYAGPLGVEQEDLDGLELARSHRSPSGTRHLVWAQTFDGIPAVDGELRANVTADGRLLSLAGLPTPDLEPPTTTPRLDESEARAAAARAVAADAEHAEAPRLAVLSGSSEGRLVWRVLILAPEGAFDVLVDALDGHTLRVHDLRLDATALVHENFPGAALGGAQGLTTLNASWLSDTTRLYGPNVWAFADPGDTYNDFVNPAPAAGDEIAPSAADTWSYTQDRRAPGAGQTCPAVGCTWDQGNAAFSWTVNRNQAGTQLFWFVNRFHDHVRFDPSIAFDGASGAMENADRVFAQVDDGSTTNGSFPNCGHVNNASMTVPPNGYSPLLETYLWTSACGEPGVRDVNSADDAYVVYHEYTHGLSFRLVTDASGVGALLGDQSGAMGEGISDWYAKDFLVSSGLETDTAAPGEVDSGVYLNAALRTEPFDCPVNSTGPACPGTSGAGSGGYTYGDFGKVIGFPEVHADGEIWAQTLWDLRRALVAAHGTASGVARARALITDGMRLSPAYPSFLEMRNAILQAETARGYGDRDLVWAVFAARGMGVHAATEGDSDTTPTEDFTPPGPLPPQQPPPTTPPIATVDTTAPVVLELGMTVRRFRAGSRKSAFRFRLSEAGNLTIGISRALAGRRVRRSCRRPSRRLRRRPRCTRHVAVGRLGKAGLPAGQSRVAFNGRLSGRALKAGTYRARLFAVDGAGNRSRTVSVQFKVLAPRRR